MTDATDTPAKPAWIRHPPCGVLIFNETLNVKAHKLSCTFDIKMAAQLLEARVKKIEDALKDVPAPVEPSVDLEDIGAWVEPEEDDSDTEADDLPGGEPFVQDVERDEWDDDENSLASSPAGTIPFQR